MQVKMIEGGWKEKKGEKIYIHIGIGDGNGRGGMAIYIYHVQVGSSD